MMVFDDSCGDDNVVVVGDDDDDDDDGDYDNHYVDGDDECFCSWRNIEFVQEHIVI